MKLCSSRGDASKTDSPKTSQFERVHYEELTWPPLRCIISSPWGPPLAFVHPFTNIWLQLVDLHTAAECQWTLFQNSKKIKINLALNSPKMVTSNWEITWLLSTRLCPWTTRCNLLQVKAKSINTGYRSLQIAAKISSFTADLFPFSLSKHPQVEIISRAASDCSWRVRMQRLWALMNISLLAAGCPPLHPHPIDFPVEWRQLYPPQQVPGAPPRAAGQTDGHAGSFPGTVLDSDLGLAGVRKIPDSSESHGKRKRKKKNQEGLGFM